MIRRNRNLYTLFIVFAVAWFMLFPSGSYEEPFVEQIPTATPTVPVSTPTITITPEPTITPTDTPTPEITETPTVVIGTSSPHVPPLEEGVCFCKVNDVTVSCPTCKCHSVNQCVP